MQITIRPIGRYFQIDEAGFIINDTRPDTIPYSYQSILTKLIEGYQATFTNELHSVWLRGSLARGLFVPKISDIDSFALVNRPNIRWKTVQLQNFNTDKYNVPIECCISSYYPNFAEQNPRLAMQIQTQAHCLWGNDIRSGLPKYRPSKEMALNYRWLAEDVQAFFAKRNKTPSDYQTILKILLRTAFELVMPRSKSYTPDLYYCYLTFAQFYPSKELVAREILWHYLNPLDFVRIMYLVRTLGTWILEQLEDF